MYMHACITTFLKSSTRDAFLYVPVSQSSQTLMSFTYSIHKQGRWAKIPVLVLEGYSARLTPNFTAPPSVHVY